MRTTVIALVLLAGSVAAQQTPTFTEAPVYVTAIDLITEVHDRSGKVPMDLTPADFAVFENGREQQVIGVEYLGAVGGSQMADGRGTNPAISHPPSAISPDWQFVVYFDCTLSSETNRRSAAQSIAQRLDELTRIGTVEIVAADPSPELVLQASTDPIAIKAALDKVTAKHAKPNWLVQHRRQWLNQLDMAAGQQGTEFTSAVKPYILQEIEVITRFRRNLLEWLSRYPRHAPRALMLVSDGFELDPTLFYSQTTTSISSLVDMQKQMAEFHADAANDVAAQFLAAAGWTTIGIPGGAGSGGVWADDTTRSSMGRTREFIRAIPGQTAPSSLINHARQPLQHFADTTGGAVLANAGGLQHAVESLAQRVKITYQVSRPPDGRSRKVEIRAKRPSLHVRTTQWAASTTPEEVAAARVATLLRGRDEKGELPTTARIEWYTKERGGKYGGLLFIKTDLDELAPILRDSKPSFRVTIAARGSGQAFAVHRVTDKWDKEAMSLAFSAPITAPNGKISIAVSVEELTSGAWGAAVVESK